MSRRGNRALLVAGLVLVLASSNAQGLGTSSSESGKRAPLPRPLGMPPASTSSAPSSSSRTGALPGGGGGDGVIDVSSPAVREYSAAELAAMQDRATARQQTSPTSRVGTVRASPELEPRHGSTPAGYDPAQARARASEIARHLAAKGPKAYSRTKLREWQRFAGLHVDGVYAGSTRGALVYFGVDNPPRPFGAPVATLPYHPPDTEP